MAQWLIKQARGQLYLTFQYLTDTALSLYKNLYGQATECGRGLDVTLMEVMFSLYLIKHYAANEDV
jgi:hypothetical protein